MNKEEKLKALDAAISQIERQHGKGAIMKLGDSGKINVETIPTGSLSLDLALGLGGIPKGRVVEIYGPESSGKTTVALHMIAEAQKRGGVAGFIDAEHALDPVYAKAIGVDIDNLYISQPDYGEQALEITETMVRSGAVDIIIVDSVAALVPKAEIDGDMGDSHMGQHARLMSQALRKLTGIMNKTGCTVVFINQLREKIGVMFGNPETTTGGRALKFYASVRLDVRRVETLKAGGEMVGNRARVKVVKNKIAPPFKEAEFDIMFGKGISKEGDILDLAAKSGIVIKSGSWYAYNGEKIGQGRENAKKYFMEHPDIMEEVDAKVREFYIHPEGEEETEAEANNIEKASEEESKAIWNQNAEFWDCAMGDESNDFHREVVRPKVTELLNPDPTDYILDIACGNGNYSAYLAEKAVSVLAFDYSEKMVELAKKRQKRYADHIEFCVADATNETSLMALKRNKPFTKAVSNMAVMDITDIKPLFTSVYKLLEDNGVFVFATQHPCFVTLTEKYMTPHSYYDIAIEGQPQKQCYYHRSLQDIFNLCFDTGFVIDGFYEECYFNKEIPDIIIVRAIKIER